LFNSPIHLGLVAGDDTAKFLSQESRQGRGLAGGAHDEHRQQPGDEGPQPGFSILFLGRRFVDVQVWLGSSAASSSYGGRRAAVTCVWIFTVKAGLHG
jgi:hypothetical protein